MAETARRHIVASSTGGILAIKLLHGLGLVENVEECEGQMSEAKKSTEPFGAAIASIGTIEYMKPDWDHHRGIVPSPAVRQAAVEFLRKIARDYGSDIPEPTMVAPTSEGFVALEWRLRTPAEAVEVVIHPNGVHEYSVRDLKTRRFEGGSEEASEGELAQALKMHVAGRHTIAVIA